MPSAIDPTPSNPQARLAARLAALEDRIAALERAGVTVPITTGGPAAGIGRDGSVAGDTGNKLWIKINGVWRYVAVT